MSQAFLLVGTYKGCFTKSHWGGSRQKHCWDKVAELAPRFAERFAEVPNWIRAALQISAMKGPSLVPETGKLPPAIAQTIETMIMERVSLGEEMTLTNVSELVKHTISMYNQEVKAINAMILEGNTQVIDKLSLPVEDPEHITEADAQARSIMEVAQCTAKEDDENICNISSLICDRWGFTTYKHHQPGHLKYSHHTNERTRDFMTKVVESNRVHPRLVANIDQARVVLKHVQTSFNSVSTLFCKC